MSSALIFEPIIKPKKKPRIPPAMPVIIASIMKARTLLPNPAYSTPLWLI